MPSLEEIKAAKTVLTDDCIADMQRGVTSPENVIKLMLEAAEKVRSSGSTADWDQRQLWPLGPNDT